MTSFQLPRLFELAALSREGLFKDFEQSLRLNPVKWKVYRHIEQELTVLPLPAWLHLKSKLLPWVQHKHRRRGWQPAFDILNEAKAFAYLHRLGVTDLRFIPPSPASGKRTPDIEGSKGNTRLLCEVKTINISDDEAITRRSGAVRAIPSVLPEEFFQKLNGTLKGARSQVATYSSGSDQPIYFVVLNFDDHFHESLQRYLAQIRERIHGLLQEGEEIVFSVSPSFYFASAELAAELRLSCSLGSGGESRWKVCDSIPSTDSLPECVRP